jgi:hypothetical protein
MRRAHALWALLALAAATAIVPTVAGAEEAPPVVGGAPALNLRDGQALDGTVTVKAEPTAGNDPVADILIDDRAVGAARTAGTAHLAFDMGGNGAEARYHNYITVNDHTDRVHFPDTPGGAAGVLDFPGEWLRSGVNTVTVRAGANWVDTTNTAAVGYEQLPNGEGGRCPNYDDFALGNIGLSLLGVVIDGEQNPFSYGFGDGTCGSSTPRLTQALTFVLSGEPGGTTSGLSLDLDTRSLPNGTHTIEAITRSGAATSVTVGVNNPPAGSAKVTPAEGAPVRRTQPVIAAAPRDLDTGVDSITLDGAPARNAETLAPGTSTFAFTVEAGDSIEARYHNYLMVNGNRVDLGGDYGAAGSEAVSVKLPNRFLRPGGNTIQVVTGDYDSGGGASLCANHDDFGITRSTVGLAVSTGTAALSNVYYLSGGTRAETADATLALGDGTCGTSKDAEFGFTISGARTTRTIATLGSGGEAHLRVFVGGNGTDGGYQNQVLVNGIPLPLGIREKEVADLSFPNEWLVPGVNVLGFVAGVNPATVAPDCPTGDLDDFTLRDFELLPAGGTAVRLTRQTAQAAVTIGSSSYPPGSRVTTFVGDGTCGSTHDPTPRKEVLFEVDPALAPKGLRADVDTTTLADGRHRVTARSGDKTATREFTVDNAAPVVVGSVPAEGQRLTAAVALDVEVEDATGVAGTPTLTLDGKHVRRGDQIGHGLPAGAHTLAVTATDPLGNTATREVRFTSASIPDVPTALDAAVTGTNRPTATLSAKIPGADGVPLTATFTRADLVPPSSGYQGTAAAVPTTLDVRRDGSFDAAPLRPLDGRSIGTPSSRDVVFQRYDVPLTAAQRAPTLRWEGTIDPARVVALRVWDPAGGKWDVLTSSRGRSGRSTVLTAPLADAYRDGGTVHVLVTGEDPFADDLSPRDSSARNDKDRFADPASYDFALAHFTDTQYLSEGAAGGTYDDFDGRLEPTDIQVAEEQAIFAAAYREQTQWIADNAAGRKIAYAAHTGDVIENDYHDPLAKNPDGSLRRPGLDEQVDREFAHASGYQKVLDDKGVVNQVIAGNHDNQLGAETGPDSRFSRTFGADRYYQVAGSWPAGAEYHAWDEVTNADGTVTPGRDNQNNYVLFSAGGLDFVAVGLSYGVTPAEAKWADSVFKRYKDRNGILLSHDYLRPSTSPDGRGAGLTAPDGSPLFKLVVEANPNVFLVLAGHEHGVGTNVRSKVGVTVAHDVVELLADYQFYTVAAGELWPDLVDASGDIDLNGDGAPDHKATDRLQFGASFLRLLQFDVDRAEMHIDTYSPFLHNFGATEYDIPADGSQTRPRYNGAEDNLTLPVDLTTRKTSFATDSLAVYVPSTVIGTDEVTANGTASVNWTGLLPAASYAWVVSAKSAGGGVAAAQPAVFRTAKGVPTVTATSAPVDWGVAAKVTVNVQAAPAPVAGTVVLREGGTVRGSAALSGGTATFTLPVGLAGGTHRLTASYSGSDHLDPAGGTVTVTVNLPAAWRATTVYDNGDRVTYRGKVFAAKRYNRNQPPGGRDSPWRLIS